MSAAACRAGVEAAVAGDTGMPGGRGQAMIWRPVVRMLASVTCVHACNCTISKFTSFFVNYAFWHKKRVNVSAFEMLYC